MTAEVKQLIEFAIQDLVAEIVANEGCSLVDAMDRLYHSDFFRQLSNPDMGLYRESGAYLYAAFAASGMHALSPSDVLTQEAKGK